MKICVAQIKPLTGDIQVNIQRHKLLIDLALSNGANTIIFPELSIAGYEPKLSKELATNEDDSRFDDFQEISDTKQITIGIGMPVKRDEGILISMIIFQPHKPRDTYSKQHIHPDEEPYFIKGPGAAGLIDKMALAICYELSIPEHSERAYKGSAEVYIASVAKTLAGVERAAKSLSDIATKYSMIVLMSNCIGQGDGVEFAGRSSIWNAQGLLLAQLDDKHEGILIIDTDTQEIIEKTI